MHNGQPLDVFYDEGVHQGDPLSLPLFSMGLQVLLELLVAQFPDVRAMAYADNVCFLCPLSRVAEVYTAYATLLSEKGLSVNPAESFVFIPSSLGDQLHGTFACISEHDGAFVYNVSPDCSIPVVSDGFCMLGAPFGLESFKSSVLKKLRDKIAHDLQLITEIPVCHIRAKLLVYCVNARFDYFMGTMDLPTILPQAADIDGMVKDSVSTLLGWENIPERAPAFDQLRLPIRKGGWGLHSKVHSAPAAVLGAFSRFRQWVVEHPELFHDPLYGKALGLDLFLPVPLLC